MSEAAYSFHPSTLLQLGHRNPFQVPHPYAPHPKEGEGLCFFLWLQELHNRFPLTGQNYVTWKRDRTDMVDLDWEEPEGLWRAK